MWNIKKIHRNSNSSFIILRRWTSPITDVAWSVEMLSFYDLKDVYIIFIQQMRYKNSHKQKVHEYKDTLQSTPVITDTLRTAIWCP